MLNAEFPGIRKSFVNQTNRWRLVNQNPTGDRTWEIFTWPLYITHRMCHFAVHTPLTESVSLCAEVK